MGAYALGGGNEAASEGGHHGHRPSAHPNRQRLRRIHPISGSSDYGHSSEDEDEVSSLLSSWPHHPNRGDDMRSSRHGHPQSGSEINISDAESDVDSPPPLHRPGRRRQVTFDLQNTGRPGHTSISGGNQSSVGGSQKIITDHGYNLNNRNETINNYALINVHIHVGDPNTLVAFTVGLFGRGDSMTLRCT